MKAVVVAGGEADERDHVHLTGVDLLIAADGGAHWLERHGATPHVLVGDLDSVDPGLVNRLEAVGVEVEPHAPDKDASDAELAVARAAAQGADEIVLLGALAGGRLDHALANLLLLSAGHHAGRRLLIVSGDATIRALHAGHRTELGGAIGDVVTLLPVGGDAIGVTTAGLRYPLDGETLAMGSSRGLSNEVAAPTASVRLERGTLLIIETARGEIE